MKNQKTEQTAYQNATLKVEFIIHLVVYLAVNALLAAINILLTPGYLWFIWPLLGWGIGVISHGIRVRLSGNPGMKEQMIAKEMKKVGLIISFALLTVNVLGQEAADKSYHGFGGPLFSATVINDNVGFTIGGKGGAVFGEKLAFGGLGFGMVYAPSFRGIELSENTNVELQMSFGAGGVFFEYILNFGDLIQFSIPLNIMAGGIHIYENNMGTEIESSAFFIIEPGISIDFNVADSYTQTLFVTYRQAIGSSLATLEDATISGLNLGLLFKFGKL